VEAKLFETLDGITGSGFDINEGEVQRAKNKLVTRATLQGERPAGRMQALGAKWMYHGRYVSLDEELDHLLAVTVGDLEKVLGQFTFKPRTIVTLGPEVSS
jgi:predicted Zn-dependent peptidase